MPPPESSQDARQGPSNEALAAYCDYLRRRDTADLDFDEFCRLRPALEEELRALDDHWRHAAEIHERLGSGPLSEVLKRTWGDSIDPEISLYSDEGGEESSSSTVARLGTRGRSGKSYSRRGLVARGGMGAILRVWDEDLRRNLAMKIVLGKDEEVSQEGTPQVAENQLGRFLEEAQVSGQLDHPGVVPIHELGVDRRGAASSSPCASCKRPRPLARGLRPWPSPRTRTGWNDHPRPGRAACKVCEAMAYAHHEAA